MNTCSAVREITSRVAARPSMVAVMSRKMSSSPPSRSYRAASSTGSPASRSSRNFVPFTTRPPSTSRQGTMRLASVMPASSPDDLDELERLLVQGLARGHGFAPEIAKCPDIVGVADAPARDQGGVGDAQHMFVQLHVGPLERAVASDRRHEVAR